MRIVESKPKPSRFKGPGWKVYIGTAVFSYLTAVYALGPFINDPNSEKGIEAKLFSPEEKNAIRHSEFK